MTPSKENPDYSVVLTTLEGVQYELTPIVSTLELSHQKEQLAQSATLALINTLFEGKWVNSMIEARQRVCIYANDGERHEEVFRGFVWSSVYLSSTTERELTVKCYDNLIYWQESEDTAFFPAGWTTESVVANLAAKWGIPLTYRYQSISHGKLALQGTLSDLIASEVLDKAKKQTGVKYAVIMKGDTAIIRTAGDNEDYYKIVQASNAIHTKSGYTMDDMVTQVLVLGAAKNGSAPVEATVSGDTAKYGTLQKLQSRGGDTTLAAAKEEAQSTVDEKGGPKWEYELKCSDIPWIRKGDKVYVSVGGIYQKTLIVWGIDRSINDESRDMTLTMEDP